MHLFSKYILSSVNPFSFYIKVLWRVSLSPPFSGCDTTRNPVLDPRRHPQTREARNGPCFRPSRLRNHGEDPEVWGRCKDVGKASRGSPGQKGTDRKARKLVLSNQHLKFIILLSLRKKSCLKLLWKSFQYMLNV